MNTRTWNTAKESTNQLMAADSFNGTGPTIDLLASCVFQIGFRLIHTRRLLCTRLRVCTPFWSYLHFSSLLSPFHNGLSFAGVCQHVQVNNQQSAVAVQAARV